MQAHVVLADDIGPDDATRLRLRPRQGDDRALQVSALCDIRAALPKTQTGKIQRFQFIAHAAARLASGSQGSWTKRGKSGSRCAMSIVLYDLAGADPDIRFSPYCWRTRFALAHKGLPVETVPWRFTDRDAIAFSGQAKVPVIKDGEKVVSDSWAIAEYLEEQVTAPTLFGGGTGRAHAAFVNGWADAVLVGGIARFIVRDLLGIIDPKDDYFRSSREARFGAAGSGAGGPRRPAGGVRDAAADPARIAAAIGWAEQRRATRIISLRER